MTQSELGKLVRNSAKMQNQNRYNQQAQQLAAASRNLHNRHQPLQYAPSHHRQRGYSAGSDSNLNDFGAHVMGASAATDRGSNVNNDDDDDESASYGPGMGANFDGGDDVEGSRVNGGGEGQAYNLDKAASGYPGQSDYNEGAGAGFGFGGASGYGPSSGEGSEFGPSEGFGGEGRRVKSASSPMGSRGYGSDDDAGAPQYGPNSAINSGGNEDDEGRAAYAPEGSNDGEGSDDE